METTPVSPDSSSSEVSSTQSAVESAALANPSFQEYTAKPMTFLGMYFDADEAKEFWDITIKALGRQIDKDNKKLIEEIKKFGTDEV